jgi:hypothetical protein
MANAKQEATRLRRQESSPALYSIPEGELPLSGAALAELMGAVLAGGTPLRFRAKGWSMAPFIRNGDVITVSPMGAAGPGIGAVVAFVDRATERLVVHRVVARHGAAYAIQGDNVPGISDGTVRLENILGRVTGVTRNGEEVWAGLGPERRLIALLSRAGWLLPLHDRLAPLFRPLLRRRSH